MGANHQTVLDLSPAVHHGILTNEKKMHLVAMLQLSKEKL